MNLCQIMLNIIPRSYLILYLVIQLNLLALKLFLLLNSLVYKLEKTLLVVLELLSSFLRLRLKTLDFSIKSFILLG